MHAHFQLFVAQHNSNTRWRLLSGNNRDVGRSAPSFADATSCLQAVEDLLIRLDELRPVLRRAELGQWRWTLLAEDEPIAVGSHAYDRLVRCEQAMANFVAYAPQARVNSDVMASHARRWRGSVSDRPLVSTRGSAPVIGLRRANPSG